MIQRLEPGTMMQCIIYVLGGLGTGGAERRSLQLIRGVTQRYPGTRVIVCDVSGESGELADAFIDAGISLIKIGLDIGGLVAFRKAVQRHKPQVVHANVGIISGYFMSVAWLSRVPIRISHFRTPKQDARRTAGSKLRGMIGAMLTNMFSTDIVGVSCAVRAYARVPARKWRVIYNGIPLPSDADDVKAAVASPRKILLLGRIHPVKNFELAIDIFEAVFQDGGNVQLHIAGTGDATDLDRLAARLAGSRARRHIMVHGYTANPETHLRSADLLLLPSAYEGLPGSVLEALSFGVPVVASDLPGVREIAAQTEGIALVDVSAPAEAWAAAISRQLRLAERSRIAGSFARSPFVLDRQVAAVAELWGARSATTGGDPRAEERGAAR